MASIDSRAMVDRIIAAKGRLYLDEPPVVKIVQYRNQFDGRLAYGLIFKGENLARYEFSAACHDPVVLWEA
jgi:Holliday junction resolvase